jgi:AcrR family transcriptional regulator
MRTNKSDGSPQGSATFTQAARASQLIRCTIEALGAVGYQQTTVAEVARRAGVSKGVVTYHFPARDDLIWAVVADVFKSVAEEVGDRLGLATPDRFVATYIGAWVDYYRSHWVDMTAIAEIWTNFRDAQGHPHLDARTLGQERAIVEAALSAGQTDGTLGNFSPRVVAVTMKAALDGLLAQLALEPELDLDGYRDALVDLFERAVASPSPLTRDATKPKPRRSTNKPEEQYQ